MAELVILCEGATEVHFVVSVLAPHLRTFNIAARPFDLRGTPTLVELKRYATRALRHGARRPFVTTMLDLYGLRPLPGSAPRANETAFQRVGRIEEALQRVIPSTRFIPYIQLHEFEALVLVDVDEIPIAFPGTAMRAQLMRLKESIGSTEPELVNERPNGAPSKRLIEAIPAYERAKSHAGPQIAAAIGLYRLRAACPHFNAWLTALEHLTDT